MTAVIAAPKNARESICVTFSVAASDGKKNEQGTMMLLPKHDSNPVAVADPPETQILTPTPATTEEAPLILTNCKIQH
jgi:hypothetical protein